MRGREKVRAAPAPTHETPRPHVRTDATESLRTRENSALDLQRSAGNRAVTNLFASGAIQASLRVSRPGDADELEADRVADRVVSAPDQPTVHRKCNCEGGGASCPACEEEEVEQAKGIHRKAEPSSDGSQSVQHDFLHSMGPGQPLDPSTRGFMESHFGYDFGKVRVHTDDQAAESARSIHARAYTLDHDVVFDSGAYAPKSSEGKKLLAHELTHVVQQSHASTGKQLQRAPDQTAPTTEDPAQKQKSEPGFFARLGHGISNVASAIGHGIGSAAHAVWSGIKAVGHGIATAAGAVWEAVKWFGNQFVDKVTGIFERVMHWITRLPERVARLLVGLWEGVKTLRPWALEWWASLGKVGTWGGFLKWLGARILELGELLGVGEIAETLADFIKFNTRKMTGAEVAAATSVFGSSINLSLVRIDTAALFVSIVKKIKNFSDLQVTILHTINSAGDIQPAILIHELTHVWQYQQMGAIYMPEALHAQSTKEGYDYDGVHGLQKAKDAGKGLSSFNLEQQAHIVQDYYGIKHPDPNGTAPGTIDDLPLYAHFVKEVSSLSEDQLAGGRPGPKGDFVPPAGYPEKRLA